MKTKILQEANRDAVTKISPTTALEDAEIQPTRDTIPEDPGQQQGQSL
jgi:hypothetical protein